MDRALPRPLDLPWRRALLIGGLLAIYVPLNMYFITRIEWGPQHTDWQQFLRLPEAIRDGALYDADRFIEQPWVWSPLFAPIMVGVTWLGYWGWVAVKFAALTLLWRTPWLIALALASFAFWIDAAAVNVVTLVFVSGALALRGSRWAAYANLALFLFMPRLLQLPMAVYLLWKMPDIRRPFLVGAVIYGLGVLASGYAFDWITTMLGRAEGVTFYGPQAVFGAGWVLVGIPLAALLAWRGLPGTAGVMAVPYTVETYWIMPLLDLSRRRSP